MPAKEALEKLISILERKYILSPIDKTEILTLLNEQKQNKISVLTPDEAHKINLIWDCLTKCTHIKIDTSEEKYHRNLRSIYGWLAAHPEMTVFEIMNEIRKADNWLHEKNRSKRNYFAFVGGWIRRSRKPVRFLRQDGGKSVPVLRQHEPS